MTSKKIKKGVPFFVPYSDVCLRYDRINDCLEFATGMNKGMYYGAIDWINNERFFITRFASNTSRKVVHVNTCS